MRDKPEYCYASGCLLAITCRNCKRPLEEHVDEKCADGKEFASLSTGFVLGTGDPKRAKYAFVLEAPGREEVSFHLRPVANRGFFADEKSVNEEINVRKRDYPGLPDRFIRQGAPVVGQSGAQLQYQAWPKSGIERDKAFLDNTIRCLPPKGKDKKNYPTGAAKSSAEFCCRHWDRLADFNPNTVVFGLHPAGILREITPLPLEVKDMEKVRDFTAAGRRVLALLGGKAVQAFSRFGSNVTKWRGHYYGLAKDWGQTYKERFAVKKVAKKQKAKLVEDDFFPVSPELIARRKAKMTRPAELDQKACRSAKRYAGARPPKCNKGQGCAPCWDKFESEEKKRNETI